VVVSTTFLRSDVVILRLLQRSLCILEPVSVMLWLLIVKRANIPLIVLLFLGYLDPGVDRPRRIQRRALVRLDELGL